MDNGVRQLHHRTPFRLVGSQLLEQQEEWQLERRRFFSEVTMAKIPEPEEMLEFSESDPAIAVAPAIS